MSTALSIILFFLAVVIHEIAHGWVAYKRGDPTAKVSGRLTLNPLAHIDPMGTIIVPFFLLVSGAPFLFGWAKPVPINYWSLHNPKKDMMLVGLAGPLANLILAIIVSIILKLHIVPVQLVFLKHFMILNVLLAVFNLIPIPPLDGSRILVGLLPAHLASYYIRLERYGFFIVFILIWLGFFQVIVWPLAGFVLQFLL